MKKYLINSRSTLAKKKVCVSMICWYCLLCHFSTHHIHSIKSDLPNNSILSLLSNNTVYSDNILSFVIFLSGICYSNYQGNKKTTTMQASSSLLSSPTLPFFFLQQQQNTEHNLEKWINMHRNAVAQVSQVSTFAVKLKPVKMTWNEGDLNRRIRKAAMLCLTTKRKKRQVMEELFFPTMENFITVLSYKNAQI